MYQGISNKLEVLSELLIELGLTVDEICYMGDDINDLPILKTAGISFAPDNAVELVKESVDIVTKHSGGNGAVREMVEAILQRQTNFEELVQEFIYGKNKVIQ